jgi:predicted transcriptional regulator
VTSRNTQHPGALTSLQRAILGVLSASGPLTAEAVRERIAPKHPLKDSTVRTLLRRLEARGLVSHSVEGKVFVYRAEASPRGVAARAVERLIKNFWSGSAEEFLAGLVDEKVLSAAELERLAKKVRSRK